MPSSQGTPVGLTTGARCITVCNVNIFILRQCLKCAKLAATEDVLDIPDVYNRDHVPELYSRISHLLLCIH